MSDSIETLDETIRQFLAVAKIAGYDSSPGYEALTALADRAEKAEQDWDKLSRKYDELAEREAALREVIRLNLADARRPEKGIPFRLPSIRDRCVAALKEPE